MSTSYGKRSKLITPNDISLISTGNIQVVSSGEGYNGGFYINFYPTGAGCGQPTDMGIAIKIKDTSPNWTKLTYKVYMTNYASCWGFNEGGTHGGVDVNNNIAGFNTGLGDGYSHSINCWELPPFSTGNSFVASRCDNVFNNPIHGTYKSGSFREFYTSRRRSSMSSVAGPGMYLSCNMTGGSIIISNIFVQ